MKSIIAIDPGINGGIVMTCNDKIFIKKMPETYQDIYCAISEMDIIAMSNTICYLEDVGQGIPGQSSKATSTFARHNGHLEMALYAIGIPTVKIKPSKWEKFFSNTIGTSKGIAKNVWKNKLKGEAQRRFPKEKVTLWNADALLILEYAKYNEK